MTREVQCFFAAHAVHSENGLAEDGDYDGRGDGNSAEYDAGKALVGLPLSDLDAGDARGDLLYGVRETGLNLLLEHPNLRFRDVLCIGLGEDIDDFAGLISREPDPFKAADGSGGVNVESWHGAFLARCGHLTPHVGWYAI